MTQQKKDRWIAVCVNKGLVEGAGDFATVGEANDFFKAKTGMSYGDVRLDNSEWAGSIITIGEVNEPQKPEIPDDRRCVNCGQDAWMIREDGDIDQGDCILGEVWCSACKMKLLESLSQPRQWKCDNCGAWVDDDGSGNDHEGYTCANCDSCMFPEELARLKAEGDQEAQMIWRRKPIQKAAVSPGGHLWIP